MSKLLGGESPDDWQCGWIGFGAPHRWHDKFDSVTDCDRKMARQRDLGGLIKLMVKLPVLRGELQLIYGQDPTLRDLAEAYNEATEMLYLLRGNPSSDKALLAEYEAVCIEIESDVLAICSHWRQASH